MLIKKIGESSPYRAGQNVKIKASKIGEGSTIDDDSIVLKSVIGQDCDIERRNLIQSSTIGDMTYTGNDTSIMWASIGKYCCISRMVDIGGNEHNYLAAAMMPSYRIKGKLGGALSKHPTEAPITIGNDVWIGEGVSIVRKEGLTIGDGVVIGSGAVITKSIPDYAIVAGVPGRVIKYRFSESIIERLKNLKWWDWDKEKILRNEELLTQNMTDEVLDLLENAE